MYFLFCYWSEYIPDGYRVVYIDLGFERSDFVFDSLLLLDFMVFLGYVVDGNGDVPLWDLCSTGGGLTGGGYLDLGSTEMDLSFHFGYVLRKNVLDRYRGRIFHVRPYMRIVPDVIVRERDALLPWDSVFREYLHGGIVFHCDVDAVPVAVLFLRDLLTAGRKSFFTGRGLSVSDLLCFLPCARAALLGLFRDLRGCVFMWSGGRVHGVSGDMNMLRGWVDDYGELWGWDDLNALGIKGSSF